MGSIVVPGTSKPYWCGRRTDEMFTVTFKGCDGTGVDGTASMSVTLAVIAPNGQPDAITFKCDQSVASVQALFGLTATFPAPGSGVATASSTSPNPFANKFAYKQSSNLVSSTSGATAVAMDNGVTPASLYHAFNTTNGYTGPLANGQANSVHVSRSGASTGYTYTIGYWDPNVVSNNWYQPTVLSVSPSTGGSFQAAVATFQEGGLVNTYPTASVAATVPVISLFLSTSLTTPITFQWKTAATAAAINGSTAFSITPLWGGVLATADLSKVRLSSP